MQRGIQAVGQMAGCAYHPSSDAVVTCADCGRFICAECEIALDGMSYCAQCFENTHTRQWTAKFENTSGQGNLAHIPSEIRGWNWGAFLSNWIWGLAHNVWIALLCFVPFVNIPMVFVLGAKGNEWAWRNKKWDSIDHFKATQRTWAWCGLGMFVVSVTLFVVLVLVSAATESY